CTGGQACRSRGAARVRDSQAANRTTAPGRVDTNTITPYTTAVATPSEAPSPAAANTHAVTPSRGPQPPTLGSAVASRASRISGTRREIGAATPAALAAIRNVAAWAAATTTEVRSTAGNAPRRSNPSRMSAITA